MDAATPAPTRASRVALVTGCSEPASLGANIALGLKRRGFRVFATARNVATMSGLAAEGLELDVTKPESIAAAVKEVEAAAGRLDVLVNNAGVLARVPTIETDIDRMRAMFEVNTFAPLAVTQAFARLLRVGAEQAGRDAVVLNVGSGAASGLPMMGVYGASKAALQTLSDTLRRELRGKGIHVMTLELMGVQTPMGLGYKAFELLAPTPSGLHDRDAAIAKAEQFFAQYIGGSPTAPEVAARLVDAITAANPPPKVWDGASAAASRFILPLLPTRLVDWIMERQFAGVF